MKKLLLLLALPATAFTGRSQSIPDLTEQLALDVQKLASIKSTLNEMIGSYDQLRSGYTHIRDIVRDNFNLHKSFLDALWILSPAVRSDPRLASLLNRTTNLITHWQRTTRLGGSPFFTTQERSTITATLDALFQRCSQAIEELTLVTTDNELRMSDAQRLTAIDRIDAQVAAGEVFLQQFKDMLALEAARRGREANDITTLKALYGLPD